MNRRNFFKAVAAIVPTGGGGGGASLIEPFIIGRRDLNENNEVNKLRRKSFEEWEKQQSDCLMPSPCPVPTEIVPGDGRWVEYVEKSSSGSTRHFKVWQPKLRPKLV